MTVQLSVRVDVLCVENSHCGHAVIGVGHSIPVIEFSLFIHFCTSSQTACCDRVFFHVAIYCTLASRKRVI